MAIMTLMRVLLDHAIREFAMTNGECSARAGASGRVEAAKLGLRFVAIECRPKRGNDAAKERPRGGGGKFCDGGFVGCAILIVGVVQMLLVAGGVIASDHCNSSE